ncbi:hypothetical protein TRVL_09806 [Trypanosoma vivax]|nr:hypothetical protein TRVL_09806 [Trypanosoma vivax]
MASLEKEGCAVCGREPVNVCVKRITFTYLLVYFLECKRSAWCASFLDTEAAETMCDCSSDVVCENVSRPGPSTQLDMSYPPTEWGKHHHSTEATRNSFKMQTNALCLTGIRPQIDSQQIYERRNGKNYMTE